MGDWRGIEKQLMKETDRLTELRSLPFKVVGIRLRCEKLDNRCILDFLGGFFILFFLLLLEFFGQIAFSVAMQLGALAVFAKYLGNVFPVEFKIGDRSPRAERG